MNFSYDKYFHSRPSIVGYNAVGSNKANANPKYPALIIDRIDSFMVHYAEVNKTVIPSEMVNASGGGFDPYILVWGAKIKIKRSAKNRNIFEANLQELATANTEGTFLGLFGSAKINVLKQHLALDNLKR